MTRANDDGLNALLAQAQHLLTLFERMPAPPLGSLQELQLRLARAHAHGLVDQLVEIVSSNGEDSTERPRTPISETVIHSALRLQPPRS